MHVLVVSLLAILAGTLLLAKTKKEDLGKFFVNISRFFIIVGFVLFIGFFIGAICRMAHHGKPGHSGIRHEMMMRHAGPGMTHRMGCPPGMCQSAPGKMARCMPNDSIMKGCPKHLAGDSCKMSKTKP